MRRFVRCWRKRTLCSLTSVLLGPTFTAGALGFLLLIQWGERPER
jgi:hypothetical protein